MKILEISVSDIMNVNFICISKIMLVLASISLSIAGFHYIDQQNLSIIFNFLLANFEDQAIIIKRVAVPIVSLLLKINYIAGSIFVLSYSMVYVFPEYMGTEKMSKVYKFTGWVFINFSCAILVASIAYSVVTDDFLVFEILCDFPQCLVTIIPFIICLLIIAFA